MLDSILKWLALAGKAAAKAATTAAKNPKTWKALGATVGTVALSYGTEKLLAKKSMSPRDKLKELRKMLKSREISKKEHDLVRKKILEAY